MDIWDTHKQIECRSNLQTLWRACIVLVPLCVPIASLVGDLTIFVQEEGRAVAAVDGHKS